VYLYSALFVVPHTQGAQAWITQCYLQLHQCLPLPRKRSPDGASPDWGCAYLIAAYYSFIYLERMKGWVGLVCWLTADGLPMHISGHPSAAGRAQDRESSPVKDRRSIYQLCHATNVAHFAWYSSYTRGFDFESRCMGLAIGFGMAMKYSNHGAVP